MARSFTSNGRASGPVRDVVEPRIARSQHLCDGRLGKMPRRFDKLRIVHRDERLQRRIRALTAYGAVLAGRRIENVHRCGRRAALPERVQAAAIQLLAGVAAVVPWYCETGIATASQTPSG